MLVACAAGCGDDLAADAGAGDAGTTVDAAVDAAADSGGADATAPPSALRVTGSAEGAARGGGDRVECTIGLDFIDLAGDGAGGFSGVAVGEVFRRTFDGDAPRFEFSAFVGGPATLTAGGGGVELRLVGEQPPEAAPFWLAIEVMAGVETAPFAYAGDWSCAPILPGDPMDSPIEADGTWSAAPISGDLQAGREVSIPHASSNLRAPPRRRADPSRP